MPIRTMLFMSHTHTDTHTDTHTHAHTDRHTNPAATLCIKSSLYNRATTLTLTLCIKSSLLWHTGIVTERAWCTSTLWRLEPVAHRVCYIKGGPQQDFKERNTSLKRRFPFYPNATSLSAGSAYAYAAISFEGKSSYEPFGVTTEN